MPKTPINYSNSIIYKLCCKDPEIKDIYIGSTCNFRIRKNTHKRTCNNPNIDNHNLYVYKFIRDNGNWENWDMLMIEEYKDCESKLQLLKKERYYIETLNATLNMCIPNRTHKEYIKEHYKLNREKYLINAKKRYKEKIEEIKAKKKIYRENNDSTIKSKKKEYYIKNKDVLKEKKYLCECGRNVRINNKKVHDKTKRHIKLTM